MEARYYTKLKDGSFRCELCPHTCVLKPGETGLCLARTNRSGVLVSENYGKVTAINLDPIEKKPLYHFFPGKEILSVGTFGCNLNCVWCQNCDISRRGSDHFGSLPFTKPSSIIQSAKDSGGIGIAYTYNEPTIWFEYLMDIAWDIKNEGLKNVVVTNGYINKGPLEELLQVTHAFNTDLKGFTEEFYGKWAGGTLRRVLKTLQIIARSGVHQEITFLVIAGKNDDPELFTEMVKWIASELGHRTVLHVNRYFPAFQLREPPTPVITIERLLSIAREHLTFVYPGNLQKHTDSANTDTKCPTCLSLLVQREGYTVTTPNLDSNGVCKKCGEEVIVCS